MEAPELHPLWSSLEQGQVQTAKYLCSGEGRIMAKYEGVAGQVTAPVIVAAESLLSDRTCRIVDLISPPGFQDAWAKVWRKKGSRSVKCRPDNRGAVTVSDGEGPLGASLVIIAAGVGLVRAKQLADLAERAGAKRVWWLVDWRNADVSFLSALPVERSRVSSLCN